MVARLVELHGIPAPACLEMALRNELRRVVADLPAVRASRTAAVERQVRALLSA